MVKRKLIVKKSGGYIQSVENPTAKNKRTVYLVQRGRFTGWTPVDSRGRVIRGVKKGRKESTAIMNVLKKGHRKVVFRD